MSRRNPTPRVVSYIALRSVPRRRSRAAEALTFISELGVLVWFGVLFVVGLPVVAAALR